jgi:hypothetical protein
MKSNCLSDISPSRTHNRSDRSPGYRLCYVTERYLPRIGYLIACKDLTICLVFRQHEAVADVLQCNDDGDYGNTCSSLKEKQDDRCDPG